MSIPIGALITTCKEVRFELIQDDRSGTELLIEIQSPVRKDNKKSFFSPLSSDGHQIGWIEFAYAVTLHGKLIYRAIQLHQVSDVTPDRSSIYPLLSMPLQKVIPNVA